MIYTVTLQYEDGHQETTDVSHVLLEEFINSKCQGDDAPFIAIVEPADNQEGSE